VSRSLLPLVLLSLFACDDANRKLGDDTAGEDAWNPCTYTTTVVGYEDVTALGFSAAEVMAVAGGPRAEVLEWWIPDESPRPTTDLALEVTWTGGEIRYVDAEPREGYDTGTWEELAGGSEPGEDGDDTAEPRPDDTGPSDTGDGGEMCPDSIEMDVTLTFVTADGAFDETVDAELYALDLDAGRLSAEILYDDLAGTYVPTDPTLVPDEWEDFAVTFSGEVSATASEGDVSIGGHRDMGDGTAMAFQGVEAVWPPGSEPW
jgi:hypothetical protein